MEINSARITKPWLDEPDDHDWIAHGMRCALRRNRIGAWCGYVQVGPQHPFHHKLPTYIVHNDVKISDVLNVHGGISYSGPHWDTDLGTWWFGFDCSHFGDMSPNLPNTLESLMHQHEEYRDMDYAIKQTEHLARQLAQWANMEDYQI